MSTRIVLHIAFWLVYLLEDTFLEYFWIRDSYPDLTELERFLKGMHSNLALLPSKLLFVYFLIFFAIERGINKNKKLLVVIGQASMMLIIPILLYRVIAVYYVNPFVYKEPSTPLMIVDPRRILSALLDIGFVAGGAVALKLLGMYFRGKVREKELVKEKLEAELKFLRTQTNPHFLFNTLNNIYALARKKSDDTADVVLKLSKLLRFMLYDAGKIRITLCEEMHMIDSYLELEKIRYNSRLEINFHKEVDDPNHQIAPMILLPFIENAFKHGAGEMRFESFVWIDLRLQKGILKFSIENSKDDDDWSEVTENIGLSNVRRQLQLMYRDYDLKVQNHGKTFRVNLTLNLNKNASL